MRQVNYETPDILQTDCIFSMRVTRPQTATMEASSATTTRMDVFVFVTDSRFIRIQLTEAAGSSTSCTDVIFFIYSHTFLDAKHHLELVTLNVR